MNTSTLYCLSLFFCLSAMQASVSLKRLRVFLSHEELEEDSVDRRAVTSCKLLNLNHTSECESFCLLDLNLPVIIKGCPVSLNLSHSCHPQLLNPNHSD